MLNRKTIGLLCFIIAGIAWPLGFALQFSMPQILPVHLAFIALALWLRGSHLLEILRRRRQKAL